MSAGGILGQIVFEWMHRVAGKNANAALEPTLTVRPFSLMTVLRSAP
jgi:hypothetical protein